MSFDFFRHARTHCSDVFDFCEMRAWRRIALIGASDLGEIAILCARDHDIEFVGIVDARAAERTFAGLSLVSSVTELDGVDAYVIVDLSTPQDTFDELVMHVPKDRILAPRLLNISREHPGGRK